MKKQKLNLKRLTVKSFVTQQQEEIRGGRTNESCIDLCDPFVSDLPKCGTGGTTGTTGTTGGGTATCSQATCTCPTRPMECGTSPIDCDHTIQTCPA